MRMLLILIISVLITSSAQLFSQNDSAYYERLYYTCKTWGFVKYFHSELANCSMNWDSVLMTKLPEIKTAADDNEFNDILYELITSPGETEIPVDPLPEVPDSLMFNLDTDWFDDPLIEEEVKTELDTILSRFRPRPHCLVDEAFYNGNPTFDEDDRFYSEIGVPNEEKRLLGLFRYWNIINYFFPYKNIMDQNWDETLIELLPMFYDAETEDAYNLAILVMGKRINDSHAFTFGGNLNNLFGLRYPRFAAGQVENETVITKVHETVTDVKPGDIIRSVDGFQIDYIRDSLEVFARGSNDEAIDYFVNQYLIRGDNGAFNMTIENETGTHDKVLYRDWTVNTHNSFLLNKGPIWYDTLLNRGCQLGYVDMARLKTDQVSTMMNELWETDAIIFDIRNYPQGTLWTLVNYLYTEPIHIASFTIPDIEYPGTLFWHEETIGSPVTEFYTGQLLILFNIRTISQAEYTCMGLEQHPGSIKIGSTTMAADGNVSAVYLPGKVFTYLTGLGTFYPDYTPTQRVGIIPDMVIYPTIEGIRQGRDEILEAAFDCLLLETDELVTTLPGASFETYPNPFAHTCTISYFLTQQTDVIIEIYNTNGQLIKAKNLPQQNIGAHQVNMITADVLPGVYFCILKAGNNQYTEKLIKL